jgi:hypothetical protein
MTAPAKPSRQPSIRSGRRPQPHADGAGQQFHVGVRQHPVIAKHTAEQVGGHDRYALSVQAAAVDVGAVNAQQRGRTGAE